MFLRNIILRRSLVKIFYFCEIMKKFCIHKKLTTEDNASIYGYSSWIEYFKLQKQLPNKCPFCKKETSLFVGAHVISFEIIKWSPLIFAPYIVPCCSSCNVKHRNSYKAFLVDKTLLVLHPRYCVSEPTEENYLALKDNLIELQRFKRL